MKIDDLDMLISQKKNWIQHKKTLDMPEISDEISVWDIYQEIYKIADELPDEFTGNDTIWKTEQTPEIVSSQYIRSTHKYQMLKKMESRLRGSTLYNDHIRPKIKKRISYLFEGQVIDGKELLSYQNEQFIQVAYRSILNREADSADIHNAMIALYQPGANRIDLLESLCSSDEGKNRQVRIKRIKFKKLKLKSKRFLLKIPVVGHALRWTSAIILLPRRLRELQNRITAVEMYKLYEIKQQIEGINQNWRTDAEILKNAIYQLELQQISSQDILSLLQKQFEQEQQRKKDLIQKNENEAAEKKKIIDHLYYDYKHDLMVKDFETYREDIQPYLDRLNRWSENKAKHELKIVDLGCGFGEWVRIMQEAGYSPLGVDSNDLMMDEAINNNLPVVRDDAMSYLNKVETKTLDVLFSFHLIEHLTFGEFIDFMNECNRVLKSGGLFVCATPNPENLLTATKEFYMDPTHIKPIPIELLEFYFKEFGFDVVEKLKLSSRNEWPYEYKQDDTMSNIVFRFNMEQESSVWGVKK